MDSGPTIPTRIDRLSTIAGSYDVIFCDVWGVVHDGEVKSPQAEAALLDARSAGCRVVLLTNSPRPGEGVRAQLDALHVTRDAYDTIVTSGDATRALIDEGPDTIFHIGAQRDLDLYAGLDVRLVPEQEAEAVVVTGLFDDEAETPADYADMLARLAARNLPMICANPDIVVHRGPRLIYCAGALAAEYEKLGGAVQLAGKPHRPIYDVAARAAELAGGRLLCIGDGLYTDIRGANAYGGDALLVEKGIHEQDLAPFGADMQALAQELARRRLQAQYVTGSLA